jgi:hypothetical protein
MGFGSHERLLLMAFPFHACEKGVCSAYSSIVAGRGNYGIIKRRCQNLRWSRPTCRYNRAVGTALSLRKDTSMPSFELYVTSNPQRITLLYTVANAESLPIWILIMPAIVTNGVQQLDMR